MIELDIPRSVALVALFTIWLVFGMWVKVPYLTPWCRAVFRPWDYLGAAIFGGDGRHSISAYCGRAVEERGLWILQFLARRIDSLFGQGHCKKAWMEEFA